MGCPRHSPPAAPWHPQGPVWHFPGARSWALAGELWGCPDGQAPSALGAGSPMATRDVGLETVGWESVGLAPKGPEVLQLPAGTPDSRGDVPAQPGSPGSPIAGSPKARRVAPHPPLGRHHWGVLSPTPPPTGLPPITCGAVGGGEAGAQPAEQQDGREESRGYRHGVAGVRRPHTAHLAPPMASAPAAASCHTAPPAAEGPPYMTPRRGPTAHPPRGPTALPAWHPQLRGPAETPQLGPVGSGLLWGVLNCGQARGHIWGGGHMGAVVGRGLWWGAVMGWAGGRYWGAGWGWWDGVKMG